MAKNECFNTSRGFFSFNEINTRKVDLNFVEHTKSEIRLEMVCSGNF